VITHTHTDSDWSLDLVWEEGTITTASTSRVDVVPLLVVPELEYFIL